MILDTLDNLEKYASLNPLFAQAIEYLKNTDLNALEIGKVKLHRKSCGLHNDVNIKIGIIYKKLERSRIQLEI